MAERIVVGFDGSEGAHHALRWAVHEAVRRDAVLEVVHTWQFPWVGEAAAIAAATAAPDEFEQAAHATVATAVSYARAGGVGAVEGHVVGHHAPAEGLITAAKGANLLVVGTRGRGGFSGLLLGSVSQQCAHHAPCPVVIVPPTWDDGEETEKGR